MESLKLALFLLFRYFLLYFLLRHHVLLPMLFLTSIHPSPSSSLHFQQLLIQYLYKIPFIDCKTYICISFPKTHLK